jgi:hypothetical protein
MNGILRLVVTAAAVFGCFGELVAAPMNFAVTTNKKRFDVARTASTSTKFSNEKWGYTITIENKTFKPQQNLEVQYRQYKVDDVVRGEPKFKAIPGTTKIDTLANGAKFTFDTDPVEIEKQELKAGWYYSQGGKEKVKDSVAGYWLKILSAGEVVFEFQYPAELKGKMKWE